MGDSLLNLWFEYPVQRIFLVIALGLLRALGLTFGLYPLLWVLGLSITLRISIAFALSLPLMLAYGPALSEVAVQAAGYQLALLSPKEFIIGYMLGFMVSLPILALQFAGAITDAFRGEFASGATAPDATAIQTFSVLYLVIGTVVFMASGGLWRTVDLLYQSFSVWPIDQALPDLSGDSPAAALDLLSGLLLQAILIAAPLLLLMVAVEIILMVGAKIAPTYAPFNHSFLAKNLVAILSLPFVALLVWRAAQANLDEALDPTRALQVILP
ncbi:MAG: flagellar biosynthetic protein FliR [Pseudomonadota bacterium]